MFSIQEVDNKSTVEFYLSMVTIDALFLYLNNQLCKTDLFMQYYMLSLGIYLMLGNLFEHLPIAFQDY